MTAIGLETALEEGRCGERLWLYATYHCNLACIYCLTESHPGIANRRALPRERLVSLAAEARELGFGSLGVTGGETFMLPDMAETLTELGSILPTVALTNATLFTDRLLARLEALAGLDVALQVSLDSPDPMRNDTLRGPENFAKVAEAIPALVERGIKVRIATTVDDQDEDELQRLCELHRSWGISDDDHIVRGIVRRGRAALEGMGVVPGPTDILPELTITADGAFLHPFAPTVRNGVTDVDLLVSRQVAPLAVAVRRFLGIVADQPVGTDAAATFT
ncbi:MAG: radical SAM protein [Actinobacteria bacterium]|nr:radical SAM protein [Actinomycetota bacterium]